MPNIFVHFVLASRIVDDWRREPKRAPFAVNDAHERNAFYHGAAAPDMGYVPGGPRRASELAHTERTADLARALVRNARTGPQRAFAWGWVTHVLGDALIHPLVGRASGELVYGDRSRQLVWADAPATHVGLEVGLDAAFWARPGAPVDVGLEPAFDREGVGFIRAAYRAVHGTDLAPDTLVSAQRGLARCVPAVRMVNRLVAGWLSGRPLPRALSGLLRFVGAPLARRLGAASAEGFLQPVRPPAWLLEAVDRVVDSFPQRFGRHYRSGLASLANYHLETGQAFGPPPEPAGTAAGRPSGRPEVHHAAAGVAGGEAEA